MNKFVEISRENVKDLAKNIFDLNRDIKCFLEENKIKLPVDIQFNLSILMGDAMFLKNISERE